MNGVSQFKYFLRLVVAQVMKTTVAFLLLVALMFILTDAHSQVKILNGEQNNSKQKCAMVCSGTTGLELILQILIFRVAALL
jgi:hypothetical protein